MITLSIVTIFALLLAGAGLVIGVYNFRRTQEVEDNQRKMLGLFDSAGFTASSGPKHRQPLSEKYYEPQTEVVSLMGDVLLPPFGPPMVGEYTLKMWLIHRHNRDGIWGSVVDDFYVKAGTNHIVRPYFEGKDLDAIKRKFLATLLILTDKGVSEPAAHALTKRHAHLGITQDVYDAVMDALVATLKSYDVKDETIAQLAPVVMYFRETMVTA